MARTEIAISNARTASGLNIVAGLWLIIAPFVLVYYEAVTPMWNDIIIGLLLVCLAGLRVSRPITSAWASWVNVALGVWLVLAPFVLGYAALATPLWNDIVLGIVVIGLALWSGMAASSRRAPAA